LKKYAVFSDAGPALVKTFQGLSTSDLAGCGIRVCLTVQALTMSRCEPTLVSSGDLSPESGGDSVENFVGKLAKLKRTLPLVRSDEGSARSLRSGISFIGDAAAYRAGVSHRRPVSSARGVRLLSQQSCLAPEPSEPCCRRPTHSQHRTMEPWLTAREVGSRACIPSKSIGADGESGSRP